MAFSRHRCCSWAHWLGASCIALCCGVASAQPPASSAGAAPSHHATQAALPPEQTKPATTPTPAKVAPEPAAPPAGSSDAPATPVASAGSKKRPADQQVAEKQKEKDPSPQQRKLESLATHAKHLLALTQDQLPPGMEPQELFQVALDDEEAIRVEIERLEAIVAHADASKADAKDDSGATPPLPAASATASQVPSGNGGTEAGKSASEQRKAEYQALRALNPQLWQAQVAVDKATLAFLRLAPTERSARLKAHAERKQGPQSSAQALSEAERKAQKAESDRRKALEEAKKARSEAARLVVEEEARLLEITKLQAEFEGELVKRAQDLKQRREVFLGLRRRVRELTQERPSGQEAAGADALYDEVRRELREARSQLSLATDALVAVDSDVPNAGADRLTSLPPEIDRRRVERRRADLAEATEKLSEREAELHQERAHQLNEEVVGLNQDRLSLLAYLSSSKRSQVTGFGPVGIDQALGEIRQVLVILKYHAGATSRWVTDMRAPGASRGQSAVAASVIFLKWLVPVVVFVWWRRRADRLLQTARDSLKAGGRLPRSQPRLLLKLVDYLTRIRSSLEWLSLIWISVWLLPTETSSLLEVQLPRLIFTWTLGGSLVVNTIDFMAGQGQGNRIRQSKLQTAHIRLTSLRLIGRVTVSFGLILALSDALVGQGTLYGWVFGFCWFAAIPVVLLIVKWWREAIFELVDLRRKKSPVEEWVMKNRQGWTSFVAALVGGASLLASGSYRFVRGWVTGFELSRRVLAYMFRQKISKKAESRANVSLKAISSETFESLGPNTASRSLVPSPADEQVGAVIERINRPGGGVFAIVGERGSGKSTLLSRIAGEAHHVVVVSTPFGGMPEFAPALLNALGAAPDAQLETATATYDSDLRDAGILVDDAHRLISPTMGGLATFDRVIEIARRCSTHVSWVFAFDEVIWQFFERMRGARPLFDAVIRVAPWNDAAIANLLSKRAAECGLEPSFEHLVSDLPTNADELDREEALEQTKVGYYRLIWDYASGNPGVALHAWRTCLGANDAGTISVKVFQAPDPDALEDLPDSTVFVFRAVVQLERSSRDQICKATGIPAAQVNDALRFGIVRGYFEESERGFAVTWPWFRAITRFLTRRHLLFPARSKA